MESSQAARDNGDEATNLPPLERDARGNVNPDSVPDVIQWFLDFDQRVAIIKHPNVEEVFQWKQEQGRDTGEDVFIFSKAEDRLAIGIIQALAANSTERALHSWISQLLNALDSASKENEAAANAYKLDLQGGGSIVKEAEKIPSLRGRQEFLINCWLETLCTAEARVLGWLYKEFYGRPFAP
jgi:predicted enzyme related to lactoylglutathione lyase